MIQSTEELSNSMLGNNYMAGTIIRDGLHDILSRESEPLSRVVDGWFSTGLEHIYLVGCGGSRAVLEPAMWLLERFSIIPANQMTGWEFVYRKPARLNNKAVVVFGSHSGTTPEIIEGVKLARSRGAFSLTLSQTDTPLQNEADYAMVYDTPATNLSKLLMNYMVAIEVIDRAGDKTAASEMRKVLVTLPNVLHDVKEKTEQFGKELAIQYYDVKGFYIIASGPLYGLAYQFATCNLLEMQWKHASVFNAAEFPHGPLEIVEEGLPMIFLVGTDEFREVALRAANFSKKHNAKAIILDMADLPYIHPWFGPFGLHMPLQWFISYMGIVRNHPIQTRRYMGIENYYEE